MILKQTGMMHAFKSKPFFVFFSFFRLFIYIFIGNKKGEYFQNQANNTVIKIKIK